MLATIAPTALARANRRARPARVVAASQTRAEVIAYASRVTGSNHASRGGHPVSSASPRSPVKLATAADAAAVAMPAITHTSRGAAVSVFGGKTLLLPTGGAWKSFVRAPVVRPRCAVR